MKIRVMGTKAECEEAIRFYRHFGLSENVASCSVSELYANRGSINQYRVYVDIICRDETNVYGNMLPKVVRI